MAKNGLCQAMLKHADVSFARAVSSQDIYNDILQ